MEFLTFQPLWLYSRSGRFFSRFDTRWWTILLRSSGRRLRAGGAELLLLVVALCRPFWLVENDALHVVFLVDASESVDVESLREASRRLRLGSARYVGKIVTMCFFADGIRRVTEEGFAEFIAACVAGTADADFRDASRLADAMRMARLSFPGGMARRMVVLSDGQVDEGELARVMAQLDRDGVELQYGPLDALAVPEAAVIAFEPATESAFEGRWFGYVSRCWRTRRWGKLGILHQGVVVAEQSVALVADMRWLSHTQILRCLLRGRLSGRRSSCPSAIISQRIIRSPRRSM